MNIKFNISESEFHRLANDIDTPTTRYILHDTYGNIVVNDKLSFDIVVREDFDNGYYRMNLDVYDLTSCEVFGKIRCYEDVTDWFPVSEMENGIDLHHDYEAFKKSVEEVFNQFIEEVSYEKT